MTRAQGNQKKIYDKSTRERELKVGDQVLALLPKEENKLKLEWVGPYKVLRVLSPVDYEVSTPGRKQPKRVYHINLLKLWKAPTPSLNLMAVVEEETDSEGQELADLNLWSLKKGHLTLMSFKPLTLVLHLVREFGSVFRSTPGRTSIVEHEISVVDETPIQQKPYRVPYARREVVKREIQKMLDADVIRPSTSLQRRPRGKRRPATTCTRMRVMLTVQSLVNEKLGHREG